MNYDTEIKAVEDEMAAFIGTHTVTYFPVSEEDKQTLEAYLRLSRKRDALVNKQGQEQAAQLLADVQNDIGGL